MTGQETTKRAPNKKPYPLKGVPRSQEMKLKIKATTPRGESHSAWVGDDVGYGGLHSWIIRHYGKADHCSNDTSHITKRFEWANISGEYRRDINDFKQLCVSCHRKMDMTESQRQKTSQRMLGKTPANTRKVTQLTKDGVYVKTFSSIREASDTVNIVRTAISNALSGVSKTAGGFQWR